MFNALKSAFTKREIYCHEDDYCQQELLPHEALGFAETEIKKIAEFAGVHLAPGGAGWTDVYVRPKPPVNFRTLKITTEDFDVAMSSHLPPLTRFTLATVPIGRDARKRRPGERLNRMQFLRIGTMRASSRTSGFNSSIQTKSPLLPRAKPSALWGRCTRSSMLIGRGVIHAR